MIDLKKELNEKQYEFPSTIDEVLNMTRIEFEDFVFWFFKKAGYKIIRTDRTNDHGIDILIYLDDKTIGIQCKKRTSPIRKEELTKMLEGRDYFNLDHMMLIATSKLTSEANIFATNNKIEIKTLDKIKEMINELKYLDNISYRKKTNDKENINPIIDSQLYENLRKIRLELAINNKVPAYLIFSNKTLEELSIKKPKTINQLQLIKGLGNTKINKFGNILIETINNYK